MFVRTACRRTALVLAALAFATTGAVDEVASVTAEPEPPEWAEMNAMQLSLSISDEPSPLEYTVVPLTENLGLNMSGTAREVIQFSGELKAAAPTNYLQINKPDDIAYLSCDTPSDDTLIGPDKMLNELMQAKPKAVILYSISQNWCQLHSNAPLDYTAILSMADSSEVPVLLKKLNSASSTVVATISGNNTITNPKDQGGPGKSSVAMSILYTITGLVTLLFVIIIATGAVRAHRYPERYGPRGAGSGRPRQSRAKGIARAVLDTIPIVKFGSPSPTKPDPELEMETGTTDGHETGTQRTDPHVSRETPDGAVAVGQNVSRARGDPQTSETIPAEGETSPGCSICTEDFKVGEDVRVLPCSHQYHPNCVDPWLINISGTCPLCRFDLRKGRAVRVSTAEDGTSLPPPLTWENEDTDTDGASARQGNRLSRFFDVHRLRQASREEQMETLRRMVAERRQDAPTADADIEERHQGVGLADKLREKFRIRTREQSPRRRDP